MGTSWDPDRGFAGLAYSCKGRNGETKEDGGSEDRGGGVKCQKLHGEKGRKIIQYRLRSRQKSLEFYAGALRPCTPEILGKLFKEQAEKHSPGPEPTGPLVGRGNELAAQHSEE